ncbi:MAG: LysR family transcriptional regulator [Bacteroidales bacterium]|nr:LysR family transcriptional regulator [Bacteroidales bacterium]
MTLQQLRYIVAIDEYRHFGKAAEACGLTQSTLSLMVKKLEEELDVRIFDRNTYPLAPTQIGRRLIDQAKVVLYNVEQLSDLTRNEKESLTGPLRIGLISTVAPVLVPGLFRFIGQHYPAISLTTEEMLSETVRGKLRRAEVDMGILSLPVEDPSLLIIPLYRERFYAYVSENDPLYANEKIRVASLYEHPLWMIRNGLQLMDFSVLRDDKDRSYDRYFEGGRVGTLIQIVNENGGMTMVPETHVRLILYSMQKGLRPIVEPEISRTIALAIRKDYIHEAMLNVVIQAVKSIIPTSMIENIIKGDYIRL